MAQSTFTTSSTLTFKQQMSGVLAVEESNSNPLKINGFAGKGKNSVLQTLDPLKEGGDQTTYALRMRLKGAPIAGDSTVEGNEQALTYYSDAIKIDQARFSTKIAGRMTEQFTKQKMRSDSVEAITEQASSWKVALTITMIAGKLGTQTELTDTLGSGFTGWAGNTLTDVDSTHLLYGGDATSKATLDATDKIAYKDFVAASVTAKTLVPKVPQLKVGGVDIKGIVLMHPYVSRDLKTAVGDNTWSQWERAKLQGGQDFKSNGIISGSLGIVDGWVLYEFELCPIYTDYGSGTVQASRVLFLGAQAAVELMGKYPESGEWDYVEKKFDADNQVGFYAGTIYGVKPTIFNSKRFGMLALDVAAAST